MKKRKFRLIIRNHWSKTFNDSFIIKIGYNYQGYGLRVWQIGLFNFALCLMDDYDMQY